MRGLFFHPIATMQSNSYTIKVNGASANHPTYEQAYAAWQRIVIAVEDGRTVNAQLIRHTRFDWDELFLEGLKDEFGQLPSHVLAVPNSSIGVRQVIAELIT